MSSQSVYLTTPTCFSWAGLTSICAHYFARHWQLFSLNQQKGENDRRKYFIISTKECCWTRQGSNTWLPNKQSDAHTTEPSLGPAAFEKNNTNMIYQQVDKELKQELNDTNAYKETLEEEVSCLWLPWSFLLILRNNKTSFLRCIGYLRFTKEHIKQGLPLIQAPVPLLNFQNY